MVVVKGDIPGRLCGMLPDHVIGSTSSSWETARLISPPGLGGGLSSVLAVVVMEVSS